jgi:hypothetical protein
MGGIEGARSKIVAGEATADDFRSVKEFSAILDIDCCACLKPYPGKFPLK